MFGSQLFDVGLALAFVFLLASLVVSAVNEMLAALGRMRARTLWRGLEDVLGSGALRDALYAHGLVKSLHAPLSFPFTLFAGRPAARPAGSFDWKSPSYIPTGTFALALVDVLQEPYGALREAERTISGVVSELRANPAAGVAAASERLARLSAAASGETASDLAAAASMLAAAGRATPEALAALDALRSQLPARYADALIARATASSAQLGTVVRALANEAAGSVDGLRLGIERWFDRTMDSLSGYYKRRSQAYQIAIGLLLAVLVNVDAIAVTDALWSNTALRQAVVAEAEAYARNPPAHLADPAVRFEQTRTLLSRTGLPIGWNDERRQLIGANRATVYAAFGWMLTAIAASFGAPFWFDVLNRFVRIRATGPKPADRQT